MPTYPITLPTAGFYAEDLRLMRVQSNMPSPFSGKHSSVDKFAAWVLNINLNRMSLPKAEIWGAKLDSLRGTTGTFTYSPWQSAISALTSRTLEAELFKYSNVASIAGWSNGATSDLRVGQYMQIGSQLLKITSAPSNADGSGYCEVEFEPYARADYAAATAVEFVDPKATFRLIDGDQSGYSVDVGLTPSFRTIQTIEAL